MAQPTSPDLSTMLARVTALESEVRRLRAAQTRPRTRLPGRLLRAVLAVGLMALLLGSSASAAIPNSGTFYGCYRTAGSMNLLYVLDHSVQTTCPTGMSFTTWSQGGAGVGTIFDRLDNIPQTIPAGTSLYVGLDGETSTTATQVALPMPGAVTLSHLYVKLETAFALVGSTFSVNVYDATTSTVLPFSCVFTGIVAVYTTCDDTSGTASVPSGDKVAFVLSESGLSSITPGNMEMSVQAS